MADIGPNIKKLAIMKFSKDAIPNGGGFKDGIKALLDKNLSRRMLECIEWAKQAVAAVRAAKLPNPWINATDEEIAAEILKQTEARRG